MFWLANQQNSGKIKKNSPTCSASEYSVEKRLGAQARRSNRQDPQDERSLSAFGISMNGHFMDGRLHRLSVDLVNVHWLPDAAEHGER